MSSSSEAEVVCAMLVDHDYLRPREIRGEGRPKIEYTLNPRYGRKGISTTVPKVLKESSGTYGTASSVPPSAEELVRPEELTFF